MNVYNVTRIKDNLIVESYQIGANSDDMAQYFFDCIIDREDYTAGTRLELRSAYNNTLIAVYEWSVVNETVRMRYFGSAS